MKKKIMFFLLFLSFFVLVTPNSVKAETELVNVYTNKDGSLRAINHYGTLDEVMIPKAYSKRMDEMRGVWVSTVYNESMPKQKGTSEEAIEEYKAEFQKVLDRMEEFGMNTLYFQIRPSNDAFYPSQLNPWSEFLYGAGLNPGWDPLAYMIEETHARGYRFVGWLNAFRVTTSSILPDSSHNASYYSNEQLVEYKMDAISQLPDESFAKKHPECVVLGEADSRLILNPSDPKVREFVTDTIREIVENYAIDGVHFDDYFYLSGSISSDTTNTSFAGGKKYDVNYTGEKTLNDLKDYEQEKKVNPTISLGDFRRNCVHDLMERIHNFMVEYNETNHTSVEFGAKPAACWQSKNLDSTDSRYSTEGSNTSEGAYSSYFDLFADSLSWAQDGLIDWISPQVYFSFDSNEVPYADIVEWWSEQIEKINDKNRAEGKKEIKLYIAHGIYKYNNSDEGYTPFSMPSEIASQLKYNQLFENISGSAVYSYPTLYIYNTSNTKAGMSYLRSFWSKNNVYPVCINGKEYATTLDSKDITILKYNSLGKIEVNFPSMKNECCYGVYEVEKNTLLDQSDLTKRIQVIYSGYVENKQTSFTIETTKENWETKDYYLVPVSTEGNVSSNPIQLNLENASSNMAPKESSITMESTKILYNKPVTFHIAYATDDYTKELTYQAILLENGKESRHQVDLTKDIKKNEDDMTIDWTSYSYDLNEAYLKVIISDGEYETICYSEAFTVKSKYAAPAPDPDPTPTPDPDPTPTPDPDPTPTPDPDPTPTPDPDPAPTPDPEPEKTKKGCKKKSLSSLLLLVGVLFVLIRKKNE
jgi:uncharacterized lipoprotein YddW (UPF0748 family)